MAGERDKYGTLIDPAERYQDFMLAMYDLWSLAEEYGYSNEARATMNQARLSFMAEFEARHPGFGSGRAIWE
ncbi:hypothetical protein [Bradyrhizobium sp. G127]|jgi:hypothetical protein|uniref:hypothetical protein n=1 Tax=Bradyrhizobium sp. G127 TaxID=2904800 RepID=UPI001F48A9A7|nr:hypothetical protein [Bradyrhizobium sp. G127]MCF2524316.1 hypothetical protein [Bradyrhizobium sp. G127]